MNYWHLQMFQPSGKGGTKINSKLLLEEVSPVIATGVWDNFQYKNFIGEDKDGRKVGDIVLVREGRKPIALCETIGPPFQNEELATKYKHEVYRPVRILDWYYGTEPFPQHQGTLQKLSNPNTPSFIFIDKWFKNISKFNSMENIKKILLNKHQIILQGPPGTGKTRLAKLLAEELLTNREFSIEDVKANLAIGDIILTTYDSLTILSIDDTQVTIRSNKELNNIAISIIDIKQCINNKSYKKSAIENNSDVLSKYKAGLAAQVVSRILKDNIAFIQFHPAYTYEDFVRGISAKSNGQSIEYKTQNRILAEIAQRANSNYTESRKDKKSIELDKWLENKMNDFAEEIQETIDTEAKYTITPSCYIYEIDDDGFRYKGDNWGTSFKIPYTEIFKLYTADIRERKQIKKLPNVSGSTKQHATYYFKLLVDFRNFIGIETPQETASSGVKEQPYILIIDEINRANLPSVLGELIYALEYRNENVDSMYELEGVGRGIVLPSNLLIIGTMNTADRSVGHIDYAIRRRFAFVNVLPSSNVIEEVITDIALRSKAFDLFERVSNLFGNEFLASDFNVNDVKLGHSYFLANSEDHLRMKLEYEIKPLLREYHKDGILVGNCINIIEDLNV
jgi:MoxR-like ATPase